MKSQNTINPKPSERLQGGLLVRFNIEQNIKQDEEGNDVISYNYEEINVPVLASKKEITVAVIRSKYDINDEISILQKEKTDEEYLAHQERKELAKIIASAIVNGYSTLEWNDLRSYAATIGIATGSMTREEIETAIEGLYEA